MNLYFECNMGAAGDMIASALINLTDDGEKAVAELNSLGIPETKFSLEKKEQCGVAGLHLNVIVNGQSETPDDVHEHSHHHRSLDEIIEIIDSLNAGEKVKNDVKNIYSLVASAEAKAHSAEVGVVHFHELGMLDAIADITACAYLIDKLNPEKIICSPINVGNGTVKCVHGVLPVPAPATANILEGVPYYKSDILTELCTPTGAAVIKYYAGEFTSEISFASVKKIGVGCGTKELERANIIRIFALPI